MGELTKELRAIESSGDLYPRCPRCGGDGQIYVYIEIDESYAGRHRGEYINCPCCSGTGEAEREKAIDWLKEEIDYKGELSEDDEDDEDDEESEN